MSGGMRSKILSSSLSDAWDLVVELVSVRKPESNAVVALKKACAASNPSLPQAPKEQN